MTALSIDIPTIRNLMPVIFDHFEGLELKELESDRAENYAPSIAVTQFIGRVIQSHKMVNYLPTVLEFIEKVHLTTEGEEGDLLSTPAISPDDLDNYIKAIAEPSAKAGVEIQSTLGEQGEAYFILAMLHFALFVISTTFNTTTARHVIKDQLNHAR